MSSKQSSFALVAVSIIAALTMLISAYVLDGSDTVMFLIIALWFIPFSVLTARSARKKK